MDKNTKSNLVANEEVEYAATGESSPQPERGLAATLAAAWEQRQFLWKLTTRAFLLSIVIAFVWPKTWVSTVRLMPPEQKSMGASLGLAAIAGKMPESLNLPDMLGSGGNNGAMFVGVLRSRTVADRLIDKFDLRKVYSVPTYERAREILQDRTDIAEDRKSGIITINVRDRNKERVQGLAQAYADELNRLVAELSTSSARRERIFLEERLKGVLTDLQQAEKELGHFSSKHATLDMTAEGKAMLESAAVLQGQLIAAESELRGLRTIYTDNNSRVRLAAARAAELRKQLNKLGGVEDATKDQPSPQTDQASQTGDFSYPSIRQLPILGLTWADLYRRVKVQEAVFETLTKQYELAKVQEAKEIPTVKLLDVPQVPEKKSSPKRLQVIFAITTLAFIGGIAWIATKRAWDRIPAENEYKSLILEVQAASVSYWQPRFAKLWEKFRQRRPKWFFGSRFPGKDDDPAFRQ